jgi:DNA-binding CsgD family transcriptional regulator
VARGERHLTPDLAARVAAYERRCDSDALEALAVLSDREREVFHLASKCLMSREIARELGISHKTVETHLHRIHRKLGIRTAAELVRFGSSVIPGTDETPAPVRDERMIVQNEAFAMRGIEHGGHQPGPVSS